MKKYKIFTSLSVFLLGLLFSVSSYATDKVITDDTEIFFGSGGGDKPNILFIMDTSGSMKETSTVPGEPYDHTKEYDAARCNGCSEDFDEDYVYFVPAGYGFSSAKKLDGRTLEDGGINACDEFFDTDVQEAGFLSNSFIILANYLSGSDRENWLPARNMEADSTGDGYRAFECQADKGNHGEDDSSDTDVYPKYVEAQYEYQPGRCLRWRWSWFYGRYCARRAPTTVTEIRPDGVEAIDNNSDISGFWHSSASVDTVSDSLYSAGTLYTANYLNWKFGDDGAPVVITKRIEALKALRNFITTENNKYMGLMSFDADGRAHGGQIDYPIKDLDSNRTATLAAANTNYGSSTDFAGGTPLGETLYEAIRYYRGDSPYYAASDFGDSRSHADSITSGSYDSPVNTSCQKHHIVLLTDGKPSADDQQNSTIATYMANNKGPASEAYTCPIGDRENSDDLSTTCLKELARFAQEEDVDSITSNGYQGVAVHTIAFDLQSPDAVRELRDVASNGGGRFFSVKDSDSLTQAFQSIIEFVNEADATVAAPSVPISTTTRFSHGNTAYLALFKPYSTATWDGNLKSFSITKTVSDDGKTTIKMVDVHGVPAVNENTSLIKSSAESRWSNLRDGHDVLQGGARSKLSNSDRTLRVSVKTSSAIEQSVLTKDSMDSFEPAVYGAATDAERDSILSWILNDDNASGERPEYIADPLHSVPLIIPYNVSNAVQEIVIYSTNIGMMHFVNPADGAGTEVALWMPQELLPNLKKYRDNATLATGADFDKPYGLDGDMSVYHIDSNRNTRVDSTETAVLISGMRRGGRDYYGLDISKYNAPELAWKITGGEEDFEDLGQTWSKVVIGTIAYGTKPNGKPLRKKVMFFTGGYDPDQDNDFTGKYRLQDNLGRGLYIVDPETGEKIWSAGAEGFSHDFTHESFKSSHVASPAILDTDLDGLIDTVIILDSAGRLSRFTLNETATSASNLVDTSKFMQVADLTPAASSTNTVTVASTDRRHFFAEPVANVVTVNGKKVINIAFGSGRRPNPKSLTSDVQDRFYVIKTPLVIPDTIPSAIDHDDLAPLSVLQQTSTVAATSLASTTVSIQEAATNYGIYMNLGAATADNGEKTLGKAAIVRDSVVFSTYIPDSGVSTDCSTLGLGTNRLYGISLSNFKTSQTFKIRQQGIFGDVNVLVYNGDPVINVPVYDEQGGTTAMLSTIEGDSCQDNFGLCINSTRTSFARYWIQNAIR